MQEDDHGDDALGLEQLAEVQAVVGQAVDGEALGIGFLFQYEQQSAAPTIAPFHQQRHVEFAEALAQAFFQLFFAHGQDAGAGVDGLGLGGGEKGNGFARVVEDQVFVVLVVAHGARMTDARTIRVQSIVRFLFGADDGSVWRRLAGHLGGADQGATIRQRNKTSTIRF